MSEANNSITGPIQVGNMTNLRYLSIANNILSGPIPLEIEKSTMLEYIFLANNTLASSIPVSLGNLRRLITHSLFQLLIQPMLIQKKV